MTERLQDYLLNERSCSTREAMNRLRQIDPALCVADLKVLTPFRRLECQQARRFR
jgi:hypothetical protein